MQYTVQNILKEVLFDEKIDGDHDEESLTIKLNEVLENANVIEINITLLEGIPSELFNPAELDYQTIDSLILTIDK